MSYGTVVVLATDGAVKVLLELGLGKRLLSIQPKSHVEPVSADLLEDIRRPAASPESASVAVDLRLTTLPELANTSEPVRVGKLFNGCGANKRGFAIALAKLRRPPVVLVLAVESLNAS